MAIQTGNNADFVQKIAFLVQPCIRAVQLRLSVLCRAFAGRISCDAREAGTGKFTAMKISAEFQHFTQSFYHGSFDEAADLREWIQTALKFSGPQQRQALRRFLDQLLASPASDAESERIWCRSGSAYFVAGKGLRPFLKIAHDMIRPWDGSIVIPPDIRQAWWSRNKKGRHRR